MATITLPIRQTNQLQKMVGLIGRKAPQSLLIKTRFGIHTFGVRFPIDVLVLDKHGGVVRRKQSLLPNRVFFWNPQFDTVVELPQGTIQDKGIKKGDIVHLSY